MEKAKGITRKMKAQLCIPKLRGNTIKNKPPSPITLLDRLREAVFRFIMLCALSKATNHHVTTGFSDDRPRRYSSPNDEHHSEAVADCIEFIKKTAFSDDENRDSYSSMDAEAEMERPRPVL